MSNEIEKMFFNTFGIKPLITTTSYEYYPNYKGKEIFKGFIYPEITDRILLELIEVIIKRDYDILKLYKVNGSYHGQFDTDIDHYFANYQKDTLKDLIMVIYQHNSEIFYHQVRALFGESEGK